MKRATVTLLAAMILATAAPSCASGTMYFEADDAGQLVDTAQGVSLVGNVEGIIGQIENAFDADLFRVLIDDPWSFSAQVVVSESQAVNPQLFLFDEWGHGVIANDDGLDSPLPYLPPGSLVNEPAGMYLLGISAADCDPRGPFGDIFPNVATGVIRPDGPARFFTLEDWRRDFLATGGDYAIALTGVAGILPPSPSADFDEDGDVDHDDLVRWQAGYPWGILHEWGDADLDGDIDGGDFLVWQRQFTNSLPLNTSTSVPEPSTLALTCGCWVLTMVSHRRMRCS